MATGYTHLIQEGISFKEFALGCARNFGALIMMREEPADAPIPDEFKPSDYNLKAIENDKKELEKLDSMDLKTIQDKCKEFNADQLKKWQERKENKIQLRRKYEAMLAQVEEWEPPTPDHINLKEFMISQIKTSIDFDCSMGYDSEPISIEAADWYLSQITQLNKSIAYHKKAEKEEEKRMKDRSQWIVELKKSLS